MTKPKILRVWYAHRLDTETQPGDSAELRQLWHNGQFHYLGIQAKAQVRLDGKRTMLASEGQWGIRSDHRLGIETAELVEGDQLRAALRQIGCGERAIAHAMLKAERLGDGTFRITTNDGKPLSCKIRDRVVTILTP